ncbi:uncharacterized protein LOC121383530 [Gigantopelta aegis]|uniref:uncharacterized protein LOC121383530 n=1 Tax=Gigantopelta aegis TaxID=1735272 RepID=UPI001B887A2A|nr:uncharacterized protein LOC121383530 [Gigantopelta aegis]
MTTLVKLADLYDCLVASLRALTARFSSYTTPTTVIMNLSIPRLRGRNGQYLPSPRLVSQTLHGSDANRPVLNQITNMHQTWGQFLDHDLSHTPKQANIQNCCDRFNKHNLPVSQEPCFPIPIPANDRHFKTKTCMEVCTFDDDVCPNSRVILFLFCSILKAVGQQVNRMTAYVDASMMYGQTQEMLKEIRTYIDGTLRTGDKNLSPNTTNVQCHREMVNAHGHTNPLCFLTDFRANEHPALISLHIIFTRLHNVIAGNLKKGNPDWKDERLFQESRKILGSIVQVITYKESLPVLLGDSVMEQYDLHYNSSYIYDESLDASILNEFTTAAFRYGHSQVPSKYTIGNESVTLQEMFKNPSFVQKAPDSVTDILNGLLTDVAMKADRYFSLGITDHMFEDVNDKYSGLDLASINIQRGRDHGLPPYNDYRVRCGLPRLEQPSDGGGTNNTVGKFLSVYSHVDDVDLYTGSLFETSEPGAIIGPTFRCILALGFRNLKFGDRFWYQNSKGVNAFTPEQISELQKITLSKVLCQTSHIENVQARAFLSSSIMQRALGVSLLNVAWPDSRLRNVGLLLAPYSQPAMLKLCVLLALSVINVVHADYFDDYIKTPFDEFGFPILSDRVAEMAAMKSTKLGYGIGELRNGFHSNPYNNAFNRRRYKRSLDFVDFEKFPSNQDSFHQASLTNDAFEPHDPFQTNFVKINDRMPFLKDPVKDQIHDPSTSFSNDPFQGPATSFSKFPTDSLPAAVSSFNCNEDPVTCDPNAKYRTYDGHCNNVNNPKWGASMQPNARLLDPQYSDKSGMPRLYSRYPDVNGNYPYLPTPRYVSRRMLLPDDANMTLPDFSNMFQQWGQFTDHDITGTPVHLSNSGKELKCCEGVHLTADNPHHPHLFQGKPCFPIYIPPGDRHFQRSCMNFARSQAEPRTLKCGAGRREQMNMVTAYHDASQVYGSSRKDMDILRAYNGLGQLIVAENNLLPEDTNQTCLKERFGDYCFKAGDLRVNEHPGLTTMHTMFHRQHNRMAANLKIVNPGWDDETLFSETRKIIGAIMQHITFYEWLPMLLGPDIMNRLGLSVKGSGDFSHYDKNYAYDSNMNSRIMNCFSAAAFRFGHTLIPGSFSMGNRKVRLHTLFNRPRFILQNKGNGVNLMCRGLIKDSLQHFDNFFTTSITDHLFEDMEMLSLDLCSLNIQRGRDHGLPPYNDFREKCGLPRLKHFDELVHFYPNRAALLRRAYQHVDDVDLFPGAVSEKPIAGGLVGPTFACIIGEQFRRIKFGDRFWHETSDQRAGFTVAQIKEIKKMSLARIICDNTDVSFIQHNVFLQPDPLFNPRVDCKYVPDINLYAWGSAAAQISK